MVTKAGKRRYVFILPNTAEDQSREHTRMAIATTLRRASLARASPGSSEYRPTHREPAAQIG
jgi:hypothetical protein